MKRFSLSKNERIKSKKEFDRVFAEGISFFSPEKKIRAIYVIEEGNNKGEVKFAVAVSKKLGSAVFRNRLKRLIREAFRQNKEILINTSTQKKVNIKIVFSPLIFQKNSEHIKLNHILPGMNFLINKINSVLK